MATSADLAVAPQQRPPADRAPRHCWVVNAPEVPGRWPGVLLGWEQDHKGWLGRVILAAEGSEGMVTMTLWVRAEHLHPATATGPESDV